MHKDRKRGQNSLTEVVKAPEPSKSCAQPVNSDQQSSASSPLRFSEFSIDELLVVEICAGSARLTKTCRKIGLRGLAVDRSKERSCGTDILVLDLTVDSQLQLLLDVLGAEKDKLLLVFIAPPCGTASRARGRPIKSSLLRGRKAPQPLRTDDQPDGIDGLQRTDKLKTELANQLYEAISTIVLFTHALDVCVVVENPKNSLYWATSFAKRYLDHVVGFWTDFHNCCHGGTRDKLTRLWCNMTWMNSLQIFCDKTHTHESWRPRVQNGELVFPTAQEAAYPWLLCTRIANIAITNAQLLGASQCADLAQQMGKETFTKMNRYIFGALPRSAKLRPLVHEFSTSTWVITPAQHVDYAEAVLAKFPKGSKIISRTLWKWGRFRAEFGEDRLHAVDIDVNHTDDDVQVESHQVGIPHTPEEFLLKALEAGHPKDLKRHVGQAVQDVLEENFHKPPFFLAKRRLEFIKKYTALAESNKVEELRIKAKMPDHIRRLMQGKRIALLEAMLTDLDFPDVDLIKDITRGFKLSGWMPESNIFTKQVKNPVLTVDALLASTRSFNGKVSKQLHLQQEEDLERDTWDETEAELEQGWIWEDNDPSWDNKVVARRFGIRQGHKTRVIDDCTVCGLNLTVGTKEKFHLHTIDQLCSMLNTSFEMSSGTHCAVMGRTYDLKHAYKQFGLCEEDRKILRIAVRKPGENTPTLVGLNALPFGAIGSVAGFLRISFAIWWIGLFGLGLAWSAYFDDYSVLTRPELERNTNWAVTALLDLLGLRYADTGPKCPPFATVFKMLGLSIDLSRAESKAFTVGHTSDRKTELLRSLLEILENGEITTKEAERLRGRMLFFESFVFGRIANLSLKQFGDLCRAGRTTCKLAPSELTVVRNLYARVESAVPVPMGILNLSTWIIFTDGACEGDVAVGSVGGVLVAPSHRIVHHFGAVAPEWVMKGLLLHSKHPIHELEMIPVLISFRLWGRLFGGAQVVHYIDNESVRLALLKGSGETPKARKIADEIMNAEYALQTKSWYARVASTSNIADEPSRGDTNRLTHLGSTPHEVDWEQVLSKCLS